LFARSRPFVALLPVLTLFALPFSLCPYARPHTFVSLKTQKVKKKIALLLFYQSFIVLSYCNAAKQ
jgi:hypothetical protein